MTEPTSKSQKTILVTGATGNQGRAFISSMQFLFSIHGLVAQPFRILALTRNPSSPAAKSLASLNVDPEFKVELVKGDLDDPTSVRTIFQSIEGGVWGVFAILAFPGLGVSSEGEEKQGYTIADLSLEFGVSHFVYSSAERGGEASDEELKLTHRGVKVKIERHVRELGERGLQWTILRPGFFMENYDGTIGKITVGVMRAGLQPNTKLHLIAVEDIGHVAATVFHDPQKYSGKVIPVVGDVLTAKEQDEAHRKATGRSLPSIPTLLAKGLLALNSHTRDLIADMERVYRDRSAMEGGAEQVVQETKELYPAMTTFEEWTKARKARAAEAKRQGGWNNVSILSLVTGKQ